MFLRQQPFSGAPTTVLPWQNLDGTTMVFARCWPKNALGELGLAYCLSAGHLLPGAYILQLQPRGTFVCQRARARLFLGIELPLYTCTHNNVPGISHSSSVNTQKHGIYFHKIENLCGALLGHNKSFSAYRLMTLSVQRPVIRPSFVPITDTLWEEFANKRWWLYEIIYIHWIIISHIKETAIAINRLLLWVAT